MARNPGQWKPGQSGNPAGRPPANRALTEILERALNERRFEVDGRKGKVAAKKLIAEHVSSAITTGEVTFPNGRTIKLNGNDWYRMLGWLYQHVDGAVPKLVDVTSGGEPIEKMSNEKLIALIEDGLRDPSEGSDGSEEEGD